MKLAIVGGSSSGIGFSIAQMLIKNNYKVIITSSNQDKLDKAISQLNTEMAYSKVADFSDLNSVKEFIAFVKTIGEPNTIVLNTGGPPPCKLLEVDEPMFNKYHNQTNLSHILIIQEFMDSMIHNKYGRIINISSKIVKEPDPNLVLSCSYRAALLNSLKCLSKDVAQHNITINSIYTGAVYTTRFENLLNNRTNSSNSFDDVLSQTINKIPCKYVAKPDEYACLVEFLINEKNKYITGATINFDGGSSASTF